MNPLKHIINIKNDYDDNPLNVLFWISNSKDFTKFVAELSDKEIKELLIKFNDNYINHYSANKEYVTQIFQKLLQLIDISKIKVEERDYNKTSSIPILAKLLNSDYFKNYIGVVFEHSPKYCVDVINQYGLMPTITQGDDLSLNEIIKNLVSAGVDINKSDVSGRKYPYALANVQSFEKYLFLKTLGADPFISTTNSQSYYTNIIRSVKSSPNNPEIAKIVADINTGNQTTRPQEELAIEAIKERNKQVLLDVLLDDKKRLKPNININYRDKDGKTMLHYATQMVYPAMVNILLKKNADPNITDNFGKKPFSYLFNDTIGYFTNSNSDREKFTSIIEALDEKTNYQSVNQSNETEFLSLAKNIGWVKHISIFNAINAHIIKPFYKPLGDSKPSSPGGNLTTHSLETRLTPTRLKHILDSFFIADTNGTSFFDMVYMPQLNTDNSEQWTSATSKTEHMQRSKDSITKMAYLISKNHNQLNISLHQLIGMGLAMSSNNFLISVKSQTPTDKHMSIILDTIYNAISEKIENYTINELEKNKIYNLISKFQKSSQGNPDENCFGFLSALPQESQHLNSIVEKILITLDSNNPATSKKTTIKV